MIETIILNYLKEILDVPVLMELPEVPSEDYPEFPERLVTIEKIGGSKTNFVFIASIAFQSHSTKRLHDAAALDEEVRLAIDQMIELPEIGSVRLASNYNHTDTRTGRYRYQCVYDICYIE